MATDYSLDHATTPSSDSDTDGDTSDDGGVASDGAFLGSTGAEPTGMGTEAASRTATDDHTAASHRVG
jgi:hypothetical protein